MKRITFSILILGLLLCRTPTVGAMTYDQAYYRQNYEYLGAGNARDPLYNLWGELESALEGTGALSHLYLTPTDTQPSAAEGMIYADDSDNGLYYYNGTAWTLIGLGTGNSLGTAYSLGSKIDADASYVEIETSSTANNMALLIDHDESTNDNTAVQITNAADAANAISIDIDGQSTGRDIEGTGALWYAQGDGEVAATILTALGDATLTGAATNITWDNSENTLEVLDQTYVAFGTGDDATLRYDETTNDALELLAAAADTTFTIGGTTNGFDMTWYHETSGTVAFDFDGHLIVDGMTTRINDDDDLVFGDSSEFVVEYDEDSTDNLLIVAANASDAVQIGDGTTITDFILQSTGDASAQVQFDGSGDTNNGQMLFGADDHGIDVYMYGASTGDYVLFDQSADDLTLIDIDLDLDDNATIVFGTGDDMAMDVSSDVLRFNPGTAGNGIAFGTAYNDAVDLTWYGDTNGDTVAFDEENCEVLFTDIDIQLDDAADLILGTDNDFVIESDAANTLEILPASAGNDIKIGIAAGTGSADVYWYADTSGDYVLFDEENCDVSVIDIDLDLDDDATIVFGTGDDMALDVSGDVLRFNPGTAGNGIAFGTANTDAVDMTWYSDTSGDTVFFDEEQVRVQFEDVKLQIMDDTEIAFGDANDVSLQYDENGHDGLQVTGVMYGNRRLVEVFDANDTLTTAADPSGKVLVCTAAVDFTLPSVGASEDGWTYTIVDANEVAAADVSITRADSDTINGSANAFSSDGADELPCACTIMYVHSQTDWVVIGIDELGDGTAAWDSE